MRLKNVIMRTQTPIPRLRVTGAWVIMRWGGRDEGMSTTRTVAKAAGLLMAANLTSRILGLFREILIAGLFGRSDAADAYMAAFNLPDLFYWLLVGGALTAAFIPVFSGYVARGEQDEGWRVASSIINITFLGISVLIVIALIFTPQFVELQVPGFSAEKKELTVHLTRILLIQPLLLALSGLSMGILNSYKIFWASALGTVLYNACVILFGYLLAPSMGISGFAIGVVVGAGVNFAIQIPSLRKVGIRYQLIIEWQNPGVRKIVALSIPMMISYTLNQFQVLITNNLASHLPEGSIAAYTWAYRLFQLPIGIFALPIAIAVFPSLTEQAALRQWDKFRQSFSGAVRAVLFITIPVSVGMLVLRVPLIKVLFEHGQFNARDTLEIAAPLLYFCLGIAAQSVVQILPRMFYSLQDTWTPVIIGIIGMGVTIVAMLLLVEPMAQSGLALATSIAAFFNMLALLYMLRRRIGHIDGWAILRATGKTLIASLVMGVVVWWWADWLGSRLGDGMLAAWGQLITGTLLGIIVFALTAKLMKMEEFEQVTGLLRRKLRRQG